jgi:ABC-type methionine transport system ATPase subunit
MKKTRWIMNLPPRIRQETGVGYILISHDADLVGRFCNRVYRLEHGRLALDMGLLQVTTDEISRQIFWQNNLASLQPFFMDHRQDRMALLARVLAIWTIRVVI